MLDIINDFEFLQKNFGVLLDKSGYRLEDLANKVGIQERNFYIKKNNGEFTLAEMKKLLQIIWKPEIEDLIEGAILKKSEKGDYATAKEIQEAFR
jgi:DNA-binding Xre family transcriptional regulator